MKIFDFDKFDIFISFIKFVKIDKSLKFVFNRLSICIVISGNSRNNVLWNSGQFAFLILYVIIEIIKFSINSIFSINIEK